MLSRTPPFGGDLGMQAQPTLMRDAPRAEYCVAIDDTNLPIRAKFGAMLQTRPNGMVDVRLLLTAGQVNEIAGKCLVLTPNELVDTFDVVQVPTGSLRHRIRVLGPEKWREEVAKGGPEPDTYLLRSLYSPRTGLVDLAEQNRFADFQRPEQAFMPSMLGPMGGAWSLPHNPAPVPSSSYGAGYSGYFNASEYLRTAPQFSMPGLPGFLPPTPSAYGDPLMAALSKGAHPSHAGVMAAAEEARAAELLLHAAGSMKHTRTPQSAPKPKPAAAARPLPSSGTKCSAPASPALPRSGSGSVREGVTSSRGGLNTAQSLVETLLAVEKAIPADAFVPEWPSRRAAWVGRSLAARTIRDVAVTMVELDDALAVPVKGAARSSADRKGWAMRMLNLHTYQSVSGAVAAYVRDLEMSVGAKALALQAEMKAARAALEKLPEEAAAGAGQVVVQESAAGEVLERPSSAHSAPGQATPDTVATPVAPAEAQEPATGTAAGPLHAEPQGASAAPVAPESALAWADDGAARAMKRARLGEEGYEVRAAGSAQEAPRGLQSPASAPSLAADDRDEHVLLLPKDLRSRWSRERYETGQRSLMDVMHVIGATSPDRAVLRPSLREEARKVVGDTGLLDHLLRHMPDSSVINGQVVRRVHDQQGHMIYWIERVDQPPREMPGNVDANEARQMRMLMTKLKQDAQAVMQGYRQAGDLAALQREAQAAYEATRAELGGFRAEMQGLGQEARAAAEAVVSDLASRYEQVLAREAALVGRVEQMSVESAARADAAERAIGRVFEAMTVLERSVAVRLERIEALLGLAGAGAAPAMAPVAAGFSGNGEPAAMEAPVPVGSAAPTALCEGAVAGAAAAEGGATSVRHADDGPDAVDVEAALQEQGAKIDALSKQLMQDRLPDDGDMALPNVSSNASPTLVHGDLFPGAGSSHVIDAVERLPAGAHAG